MRIKILFIFILCVHFSFCASTEKKFEKAQGKSPKYQYNMGLFYLNNGQPDDAIQFLNRAVSLDSRYYLAWNALGLAYSMKGNFEESIKHFQKCLEINPSLTEARNNLGSIYQEMGLLDKAEQEFRKAIDDKNYSSRELPHYNLARLYVIQNRNQEALTFVNNAILINSSMVMAYNLKGIILEKLENFPGAIESYSKALKLTPDDLNIQFNLGVVYFKNNEFEKSKDVFETIYPKVTDPDIKAKIDEYMKLLKASVKNP